MNFTESRRTGPAGVRESRDSTSSSRTTPGTIGHSGKWPASDGWSGGTAKCQAGMGSTLPDPSPQGGQSLLGQLAGWVAGERIDPNDATRQEHRVHPPPQAGHHRLGA